MTNKEKASKIIDRIFLHGLNANNTFYNMTETAVLEMAKYKDSQPQIIEIFGTKWCWQYTEEEWTAKNIANEYNLVKLNVNEFWK